MPETEVVGDTSVELVLGGVGREFELLPVAIFLKFSASVAISCPDDIEVVVGFVVVELVVELVVLELELEPDVNLGVVVLDVVVLVVVELDGVIVLDVFILSIFSKSFVICEQAKQINMTNPSPSALLKFVVATNPRTNNNLPKIVRNKKFFEIT